MVDCLTGRFAYCLKNHRAKHVLRRTLWFFSPDSRALSPLSRAFRRILALFRPILGWLRRILRPFAGFWGFSCSSRGIGNSQARRADMAAIGVATMARIARCPLPHGRPQRRETARPNPQPAPGAPQARCGFWARCFASLLPAARQGKLGDSGDSSRLLAM